MEAFLDIRVIDTDAHLIGNVHPPLCLIVGPLRRKGCIALLLRTGNFTHFVQSVDGLLQCEALLNIFLLVFQMGKTFL